MTMEAKTHSTSQTAATAARRGQDPPTYINGMSPKKTMVITMVTVVGCIAILWPKVFYPMMFGGAPVKQNIKELRPGGGLRQERPTHLHPESIYQAMRERGRAIPTSPTIPIIDRKGSPSNPPPRIVEGRPGPIPGMRPPMGAGALHQPQPKSSMGFIMPLYTIGIIVFFGYTIMKIVFKKPVPNAPYGPAPIDGSFRKEVFGNENGKKSDDLNGTKLVVTAIQGLIDAADEELKLRENKATTELSKNSNDSNSKNVENSNEHTSEHNTTDNNKSDENISSLDEHETSTNLKQHKRREGSIDRSVAVMGMEVTASCEGGKKWSGRPPTPVFGSHVNTNDTDLPEPQSIYLEGSLAHESQILVADSETKTEEVYDEELNGSPDEPAVILSSKMTLSLINMDTNSDNVAGNNNEIESPLADDIEIIGHDEKTLN